MCDEQRHFCEGITQYGEGCKRNGNRKYEGKHYCFQHIERYSFDSIAIDFVDIFSFEKELQSA